MSELTPTSAVWLTTLAGPAHRPTTKARTACGLPATTSERDVRTGISTTWLTTRHTTTPCPACWPTTQGAT